MSNNPYASPKATIDGNSSGQMRTRFARLSPIVCGVAAFKAGWLIWGLSPTLTGQQEPWDSTTGYYFASLFISGLLVSTLCFRFFWIVPIALIVGQIAFVEINFHPAGQTIFPSFVAVPIFATIPAFAGSLCGFGLRKLFEKLFANPSQIQTTDG